MKLFIQEMYSGKVHKRTLHCGSCRYGVEGRFLVIRDYYTGNICHRFNVNNYGSIRFWVEEDD